MISFIVVISKSPYYWIDALGILSYLIFFISRFDVKFWILILYYLFCICILYYKYIENKSQR